VGGGCTYSCVSQELESNQYAGEVNDRIGSHDRETPKLRALISFGAKGFKHVPKELRTKWEPNSVPCIFTGYVGTNQFRVLIDRRIYITRDLTIADDSTNETVAIPPPGLVPILLTDDSDEESTTSAADYSEPKPRTPEPPEAERTIPTPKTPPRTQTPGGFPIATPEETIHIRPPQDMNPPPQEPIYSQRPWRANAGKFTSTRFDDETFSSLATHNPDPNTYNCQAYNTMSTTEPTTYAEAIKGQNNREWKEAIEEELTSLRDNNTWTMTPLPEGQTAVRCKWVFKEKRGAEGKIERYKARLVAKGFTQQYGIDYLETYAPVVKLALLRILLAIAAFYNFEIHQGDIKTAYLLGQLEEEIYMEIPEGGSLPTTKPKIEKPVCRLWRELYGLKQSGRIWNKAWDDFLIGKCHFKRSVENYAVYYRIGRGNSPLWVLIWVDDVLWIGKPYDINEVRRELARRFPLKDQGPAHLFLGMKIIRKVQERKITLCQDQYIESVLERFGLQDCYMVSTPIEPGI